MGSGSRPRLDPLGPNPGNLPIPPRCNQTAPRIPHRPDHDDRIFSLATLRRPDDGSALQSGVTRAVAALVHSWHSERMELSMDRSDAPQAGDLSVDCAALLRFLCKEGPWSHLGGPFATHPGHDASADAMHADMEELERRGLAQRRYTPSGICMWHPTAKCRTTNSAGD